MARAWMQLDIASPCHRLCSWVALFGIIASLLLPSGGRSMASDMKRKGAIEGTSGKARAMHQHVATVQVRMKRHATTDDHTYVIMAMSLVVSWACVGACFATLVFEIQAMRCQCYPNTLLAAGDFASAATIKHTLL